jgi:RNA methyltransferase, TrmH family
MVSKSKTDFIISLQKKKGRDDEKLFIIEGDKIVKEFLMAKVNLKTLIAKPEFISSLSSEMKKYIGEIEPASYDKLKKISTLKTPHNALAIVPIRERKIDPDDLHKRLTVVLDFVQDPGNLGTIIRAAAWFGIKDIVCSINCVDVYNPKVIQATMGAILNVNVHYQDIKEFLKKAAEKAIPVYGTLLEGKSVYDHKLGKSGIIILGNESKGISEELMPYINEKIMIPRFSTELHGIESLNVGMAASIIFSEFARRIKNL